MGTCTRKKESENEKEKTGTNEKSFIIVVSLEETICIKNACAAVASSSRHYLFYLVAFLIIRFFWLFPIYYLYRSCHSYLLHPYFFFSPI